MTKFSTSPARYAFAALVTVLLAVGAAACGGADASSLSDEAQRGKELSASKGCAGCHGADGGGGVGPAWVDLAGSEVELTDGSTVVADDDYLLRSILDPRAEEAAGFNLSMPLNGLTEDQAADVIAYIKELTSDG